MSVEPKSLSQPWEKDFQSVSILQQSVTRHVRHLKGWFVNRLCSHDRSVKGGAPIWHNYISLSQNDMENDFGEFEESADADHHRSRQNL